MNIKKLKQENNKILQNPLKLLSFFVCSLECPNYNKNSNFCAKEISTMISIAKIAELSDCEHKDYSCGNDTATFSQRARLL